ncbi:MAG TPA: peptidylprolyl isomerase [Candidatus Paceibacterota bacterium]|nr:peptidylprolyl isomerase [Candidatus Paceibacterota bacterium]HRZ99683.1 peptidylprolyl isomerase [Candidatus Paceibacterota bacterium]
MRFFQSALLAFAFGAVSAAAQTQLANGIAVIVNETVITFKDVELSILREADLLRAQYRGQPAVFAEKLQALQRDRIEELVARQLILHEYKMAGYNLPESIIDDIVEARVKENFGDRVTMSKTLQAQNTTFESFRRKIREQIIIDAMTRQKYGTMEPIISPFKIETYYKENLKKYEVGDQVKLRMIVLNKPADSPQMANALAKEIISKLESGAAFAEMASVYSEGSQRREGGDWGWVERSVLRTNLAEVAFKLKPGQRSDIIDTPESLFIMQVEDVKLAHTKPLTEVRDEIERVLGAQERDRAYRKWIDRLKSKNFVRYFPL